MNVIWHHIYRDEEALKVLTRVALLISHSAPGTRCRMCLLSFRANEFILKLLKTTVVPDMVSDIFNKYFQAY